jgi:outer membrane receptor for ferrienterochelin and colicin
MITVRTATLALVLGAMGLGGCSSGQSGPQVGETQPRNSLNVITQQQIQALPSVGTVEDVLIQLMPGIEEASGGIRIRGMSGAPLIVVNGVPMQGGQIPVTPRDVSRIEVLRTGGEIAAYGLRGSGGVIVIQTR